MKHKISNPFLVFYELHITSRQKALFKPNIVYNLMTSPKFGMDTSLEAKQLQA